MPGFAGSFRDEVMRLSKRQSKPLIAKLQKRGTEERRKVRDLRMRVAALERQVRDLTAAVAQIPKPVAPEAEAAAIRPTSKMVRKLRAKLGVSQSVLAKLLGVSTLTVGLWERKEGRLSMRQRAMTALADLRKKGVREVRRQLAAEEPAKAPKKAPKRSAKRGAKGRKK